MTTRPIHQMSGDSEFNEVFLTDVRVPDGMPGPEMAVTKLVAGESIQRICSFAQEMAGADGLLPAEELDAQWQYIRRMWLMAPGTRLGGGTDEILRNVIAERVLGLPGEVRTDKDVPFRELVS